MAAQRKPNGQVRSEYDPKYHPKKGRAMAFHGLNNRAIMAIWEISEQTFYEWMKKHPELSEAIYKGRHDDVQALSKSLQRRANGIKYKEVKRTIAPAHEATEFIPDPGNPGEFKEVKVQVPARVVEETITEKFLPPDVGAIRFGLTNRAPEQWREATHIDHTTGGEKINKEMDLSKLSDEEIETLAALERKAKS